ncbi:T-complex-associated testis-expressed protein 1 [Mortierella polycephala]|uniref:T-complex-associated testis-expressed protein 1 n=1 Tax=Mortierella polycephala TaxID=41804 RepID=A0A9P6TV15_9FUNG|nr:T-complex-associated testis-expressed protein 1 [Mortierella polycephala]
MAWGGGNANSVESWVKRLRENDSSFTSLHILSFRRITPSELGQVFEALAANTTLTELYASGHALDESSAQHLADALQQNRTLERLNIGNDTMGAHTNVIQILAAGLAKSKGGLVRLDLENKGLGGHEASVKALADALLTNDTLQELNLARNKLTDQDIAVLCQSLAQNTTHSLQKLDLCLNSFTEQGTRSVADFLASQDQHQQGGLKEIDLSDNEITEEGGMAIGRALETNKHLERLRMSSCMDPPLPVEDDDKDKIQWDDQIEVLNRPLSEDQAIEIRSDGDAVLEALAAALKTNETLQEIWMDYCNISSIGAASLADALWQNRGLTTIRMRNNRIGNRGARALGAALTPAHSPDQASAASAGETTSGEHNTALKNLELGSNKIGVLGWNGLVGASSLESLGLFENHINVLHEAMEGHLTASSSLTTSSSELSTPATVGANIPNGASSANRVLEKLAHLDVGCNAISREAFTQLGVCLIKGLLPSLIRLEIAGNGDRSRAPPQNPGDDDDDSEPGSEDPDDEQHAWERVASKIEEARPGLGIHWKGAGAMQQG